MGTSWVGVETSWGGVEGGGGGVWAIGGAGARAGRGTDEDAPRTQNLIFRFLQTKARVQIWMYENADTCIEGRIVGFDEYMNLVLDDAEEVTEKKRRRVPVGRILLKGDNITLMRNVGKEK